MPIYFERDNPEDSKSYGKNTPDHLSPNPEHPSVHKVAQALQDLITSSPSGANLDSSDNNLLPEAY